MAVRIVSLMARLGLDGTSFQQGLTRAGRNFQQFASGLKGQLTGVFTAGSVAAGFRQIIREAARFRDLSEVFRVTTDEVQTLDAAAKKSNQTFEDIGASLIKLGNQRREAAEGNVELRESFAEFGVTLEDLNNPALRNLDILQKIARAVQGMRLNPRQADDLNNLLGWRNGEKLAAVFKDIASVNIQPIKPADLQVIDDAVKALERLKAEMIAIGATALGEAGGSGQSGIGGKVMAAVSALLNPGLLIGKVAGSRIEGMLNPASATNPRARSAEPVGAPVPGAELFVDKAKEKEASRIRKDMAEEERRIAEKILDIQMQMLGPIERRAALEAQIEGHLKRGERLKALEALEEFNAVPGQTTQGFSPNVGGLGSRGAFTGLGMERAFALLGGSNEAKQTAENTRKTKEVLQEINGKIRAGEAEDELEF